MDAETTTQSGYGRRFESGNRGNFRPNTEIALLASRRDLGVTDMAVQDAPLLNRFFRMAVVAGVESAVRIHIDRGDDLNARDGNGQTPLMLSAARNKATICRLLIAAGAGVGLLDPSGKDALGIAQAVGAVDSYAEIKAAVLGIAQAAGVCEAIAAIEDATGLPKPVPSDTDGFHAPAHVTFDGHMVQADRGSPAVHVGAADAAVRVKIVAAAPAPAIERIPDTDEDGAFDLTGWEPEKNLLPPEDDPALSAAAVEIQRAISEHPPIDTSADWEDFEAFLPDRAAPLSRVNDAEARERLRLVLLRAIREGSVPHSVIKDLTLDDDGVPNEEADALLTMVINDLGAETDERFEYSAPHESFEVVVVPEAQPDEEDVVANALAFIDELAARRNEPLRIYQREFQHEALLTADAEVALGKAMEQGMEKALDALASWPHGIGAVLKAAKEVMSGARMLRWMSSGSRVEPQDFEGQPEVGTDADSAPPTESIGEEDSDSGFDLNGEEPINESAEFLAKVELLSGLAISPAQDRSEWSACRNALASLGLTRSFLMELTDSGLADGHGPALAFAQAMNAYRRARDQMTVANLKLVLFIAKKYLPSGEPLDDLLQEGNIGLLKAVDRYDWRRGFKFSTYATWWIRQQVSRHVADRSRTIRLPAHVHEGNWRITRVTHTFEMKNGRAPTVDEIAALVDLPTRTVAALVRAEPLPLHEINALDDSIAIDAKDEFTARDPMDIVQDRQLTSSVDCLLGTLKPKAEHVLRMHFGIGVHASMTLEEIGARFGLTRERIRQIEVEAIRRLKHPARKEFHFCPGKGHRG
ncbi:sigma-70 family RNA polymerase sigma factor [Verminephrobacter aporrectodeae subsp. tuberculatae]|uniref:sigma-70 family RNA polymerase sigma factor n=1 Tax=Verminephrobacter aporrectodeae TaxID=1110389 RepID=UPI00224401CF|nr:sigma-70 family RNA polymerase sigma factor [Verminephrobacter aporrectodeae]MCW8207911.1 sigma-70 family RNA polymerase sigma factor [Verminephrobacter aporrectodeae subsp. tuberculatae]